MHNISEIWLSIPSLHIMRSNLSLFCLVLQTPTQCKSYSIEDTYENIHQNESKCDMKYVLVWMWKLGTKVNYWPLLVSFYGMCHCAQLPLQEQAQARGLTSGRLGRSALPDVLSLLPIWSSERSHFPKHSIANNITVSNLVLLILPQNLETYFLRRLFSTALHTGTAVVLFLISGTMLGQKIFKMLDNSYSTGRLQKIFPQAQTQARQPNIFILTFRKL